VLGGSGHKANLLLRSISLSFSKLRELQPLQPRVAIPSSTLLQELFVTVSHTEKRAETVGGPRCELRVAG